MSKTIFMGVDLETTGTRNGNDGSDPPYDHLIQVGVATDDAASGTRGMFVSLACPEGEWSMDPKSEAVHGIPTEMVKAAPKMADVDDTLYDFLKAAGATTRSIVPVGWNVGAFDVPFIKRDLPKSAALFTYRAVDLNTLCFTVAGDDVGLYKKVKKAMKSVAVTHLKARGVPANWHDAGYDAVAGLISWRYFQRWLMKKDAW